MLIFLDDLILLKKDDYLELIAQQVPIDYLLVDEKNYSYPIDIRVNKMSVRKVMIFTVLLDDNGVEDLDSD